MRLLMLKLTKHSTMNRTTQISKTNGRYFLLLGNARTALAAFSVFAPLMACPSTASALSLFTLPHHISVNEEETSHEEAQKPSFPKMDYGAESTYAFPGCVGHGRLTRGARAGKNIKLYKVTNLNSDGPGSFKDAISQPNRIIVFGVAGVLDLNRETYRLKDNQTILFETAPGDGIELYNGRVSSSNASEVIVRYMRVRMGRQYNKRDAGDAGGLSSGFNQVYDHCSFTWACDENFSISSDNKGIRPHNITLQNSIIGQGVMNHSAGGLVQTNDQEGITIYRNLFIDNGTRNLKVKGLNQFVNNVIYNWNTGAYIMGGGSNVHSSTIIENNYFITGPCWVWRNTPAAKVDPSIKDNRNVCIPSGNEGLYYTVLKKESPSKAFTRGNDNFDAYFKGNYYDDNTDGTLNGVELTESNWGNYHDFRINFLDTPSPLHPDIKPMNAREAYKWIVAHGGASLPARDHVDQFMIDELKSLGKKGTILRDTHDSTQYPIANTWQQIDTTNNITDTDGDGMPDEWEDKWGLDKHDPSDAPDVANNGYTNIENYAFSLEYPEEYEAAYQKMLQPTSAE